MIDRAIATCYFMFRTKIAEQQPTIHLLLKIILCLFYLRVTTVMSRSINTDFYITAIFVAVIYCKQTQLYVICSFAQRRFEKTSIDLIVHILFKMRFKKHQSHSQQNLYQFLLVLIMRTAVEQTLGQSNDQIWAIKLRVCHDIISVMQKFQEGNSIISLLIWHLVGCSKVKFEQSAMASTTPPPSSPSRAEQ